MTHPFAEHRQHKVEHSRVAHIAKGYATGGAVSSAAVGGAPSVKAIAQRDGQAVEGKPSRQRLDKPLQGRARGGRAPKHKGTHVNVIVAPQGGASPPMSPPAMAGVGPPSPGPMPPRPPMAIPPQAVGGPSPTVHHSGGRAYAKGGRALGGATGRSGSYPREATEGEENQTARPDSRANWDMRGDQYRVDKGLSGVWTSGPDKGRAAHAKGGRTYATGGAVKSGPAWNEGLKAGTQVQHTNNKQDGPNIGRGKPITYKTGGAVEASKGTARGNPHLKTGAGGGLARLKKAHLAETGAY